MASFQSQPTGGSAAAPYCSPPQQQSPYQQQQQQPAVYGQPVYQQQQPYQQPYQQQQQPSVCGQPVYQQPVYQQPVSAQPYHAYTPDVEPPQKQHYGAGGISSEYPDTPAVEGVPLYPDCPHESSKRFITTGYQDVWAAALFLLTVIASFGLAAYNLKDVLHRAEDNDDFSESEDTKRTLRHLQEYGPLAVVASVLCAWGIIGLMRLFPRQFILGCNIAVIALNAVMAFVAFTQGVIFLGIIWLVFAAFHALWLYWARRRIPFASVLLRHSVLLVTRHRGTQLASFVAFLTMVLYVAVWVLMSIPVVRAFNNDNDGSSSVSSSSTVYVSSSTISSGGSGDDGSGDGTAGTDSTPTWAFAASLGLLLALLWVSQVCTNVSHVTTSGVVATWYFMGTSAMPPNPTLASGKRALTTSFGSICFGSLLVAIIKLIYYMARAAARNNRSIIACIAACIIGFLEQLLEWFNVYAFTYVAIYGSGYVKAAKQTWAMIKQCGWAAMFNDCLVWPVLSICTFFPSACIGLAFGLLAWSILVGVVCFLIAFVVFTLILRTVYSAVVTQFVCIAEAPDVMQTVNPEYYAELEAAITEQTSSTSRPLRQA